MIERITFSLIGMLLFPLMLMAKDYRVIDFGAVGNGNVDDAIAIQKAVMLVLVMVAAMSSSLLTIHSFLVLLSSNPTYMLYWRPTPHGRQIPTSAFIARVLSAGTRARA